MSINIEEERKKFDEWYQPNSKPSNAEYFSHLHTWLAAKRVASAKQWQSIETAPKDKFVLLAGPSGYTTLKTTFTTGRTCSDYHKGRWIDHANDDLTDWGFEPTHWMPLPKAPNE